MLTLYLDCHVYYHPYHYLINMTDMRLGASGPWLGTQIGAGGTVTLA